MLKFILTLLWNNPSMSKNIAFFITHFNERGTTKATFDYAFYNKKLLGNGSIIIFFNEQVRDLIDSKINQSRQYFESNFKAILKVISNKFRRFAGL